MARTVKEQEYAEKRNHIRDAAQRLVYTKGYERMTIQDILAELQISSGRSTTTLARRRRCSKRLLNL